MIREECQSSDPNDENSSVLERAKQALLEGNTSYAKFLYEEALNLNPQNIPIRSEMHKLRDSVMFERSIWGQIKAIHVCLRIILKNSLGKYDDVIKDCEHLLDLVPDSEFAVRHIMSAAHKARYSKLVIFISEKIMEMEHSSEDLIIIANAFLDEKIFDKATKIAKSALELDPDNEELKEILWKASVDKHMNMDTKLVTAGGNSFVPPKIDTDKIFIASHKNEKSDGKEKDSKDGKSEKQKQPATP